MNKTNSMLPKAGLLAGLVIAICTCQSARAAVSLPYYDSFNYSEGNLNAVGGPNWVVGNGSTTFEIAVSNSATLTAPAGFPAASGKGVRRAPSGTSRRSVLTYTSVASADGVTLYASMLVNVQTQPSGNELIGYLDNSSSSDGSPQAGIFVGNGTIGIGKKSSSPGFTTAVSAGTHLVVVRYAFLAASNDQVDLWVDPSSATYGASNAPASLGSTTGATDPTSLDYFQFSTSAGAGSVTYIDEFRVGQAWADVVPSGGPIVGTKLGFTTQPGNAAPNATLSPVMVQVQSAAGAAAASNNVPITVALTNSTGTLSGTTTQNTDVTGKATFNNLSIDTIGAKQLVATASGIGTGLAGALSSSFTIATNGGGGGTNSSGLIITSQQYRTNGFMIAGINGTSNAFYQIWASPDVSLPLTNWIVSDYDNCDVNGNFSHTNPISPALPVQFYRAVVGPTGTKTVAPSITQSPVNQTVAAGQTATFTVIVTGPLLNYLWYFNNHPIYGINGPTLTITNAQSGNAGSYYVIVANGAGSATSATASLRVGNFAPSIITSPQNQSVTAGGIAIFRVVADGTLPLSYQWSHGSNISGATNATLSLSNVQTNDAGSYTVTVHNNFAPDASASATLTVTAVPTALPDTNMIGFAAVAGVTGGAGGLDVYATNYASLSNYVTLGQPLIIHITNMITGPGPAVDEYCSAYGDNKTLIGDGTNAGLYGIDLRLNGTNMIVANLLFMVSPIGTNDAITIDQSKEHSIIHTGMDVWIDHCTVSNAQDGSIDITKGADNVTVSWCKFFYAPKVPNFTHELVNLIGSSDSDGSATRLFHVTMHHNWYADNAIERMPSVRWGRVHVFNNYYTCSGNNYCARTRISSQVLVENNFYLGVQNPWELLTTSGTTGLLLATNNNIGYLDTTYGNTWVSGWYPGQSLIPGTDTLSDLSPPPYSYTNALNTASDVPYYVTTYAGSGKFPYVQ